MRLTVRFQDGVQSDVLLLAVAGIRLRVVVAGREATEEWLSLRGHCYDEKGKAVIVEAAVPIEGVDNRHLLAVTACKMAANFGAAN